MKKQQIIFLIAIVTMINFGCSKRTTSSLSDTNPLIGTWVLVSSNNTSADGEYEILDRSNTRQMKILNPTHFMFIQEHIGSGEKEFTSAAGGTYEIDGNTYVENLDYASWEDYKDSNAVFTWRLEDGKWYHKGVLNSPDGEKFFIEEVWEKVEE